MVLAWGAGPSPVLAQTPGAHEHGAMTLNLAQEGGRVEIELIAPGADVVGFEHAPKTDSQRATVREAANKLADGAALFAFPSAAACALAEAQVESPMIDAAKNNDDHGDPGEAHAEFHARYHFDCANAEALSHVDVGIFKAFPSTHEVEARTVTQSGQGARELTSGATRLTF